MPFPPFLPPLAPSISSAPSGLLWTLQQVQHELDKITAQIDRVVSNGPPSSGFELVEVSTALERFRVGRVGFEPGESVDVDILITEGTDPAAIYLSFAGSSIDFFTGSSFTVILSGNLGSRALTFTSGTSLFDVRSSFNTFQSVTGVHSEVSGTGIVLYSVAEGSTEFVSVRSGGDATLAGSGAFGTIPTEPPTAISSDNLSFFELRTIPFTDLGHDFGASLDTLYLPTQGTTVVIPRSPFGFQAELELKTGPFAPGETANASNPGLFRAFTILYAEPGGPLRTVDSP